MNFVISIEKSNYAVGIKMLTAFSIGDHLQKRGQNAGGHTDDSAIALVPRDLPFSIGICTIVCDSKDEETSWLLDCMTAANIMAASLHYPAQKTQPLTYMSRIIHYGGSIYCNRLKGAFMCVYLEDVAQTGHPWLNRYDNVRCFPASKGLL